MDFLGLRLDGPCKCKADKGNYKDITFKFTVKTLYDTYSVEDPESQIIGFLKEKAESAPEGPKTDLDKAKKIAKSVTEGASKLAKVFNAAHEAQSGLLVEEASMEVGFKLCIETEEEINWSDETATGFTEIGASAITALDMVQSGMRDTLIQAATDVANQIKEAEQ